MRGRVGKRGEIVSSGRKGSDYFRRRPINIVGEYINVTARTVDHEDAAAIARDLMAMFTAEGSTIDRVFLIYNEFKSVLSQRVTTRQLLPIGADALNTETGGETRQTDEGEVSID